MIYPFLAKTGRLKPKSLPDKPESAVFLWNCSSNLSSGAAAYFALPKEGGFPSCRRSKLCLGAAKRVKLVFRFSDDLFVFMGWQCRLKRLSASALPFILQSHRCCTTFAPYVLRPAARHRFMSYSALSYSSAQRACPANMLYCRFCFFRFQTTYECPAPPDRRACLFVRRAHHLAARPK